MRILLLADLHIGAIKDTSYYYTTVTNIIDNELIFKKSDMVVILGDYFDRLFKVNEEYVSLAVNIMSYLVRACMKSETKIRIVYGTESHEMNQYKIFNHFFSSSNVDMKLFTTCTEEIVDGKSVLYIPEEYIANKLEFYKDTIYSGKKYDYIFGHGVITDGMPAIIGRSRESDSINIENKVPHFNAGELSAAGKLVVFGHYHIAWDNDNVHYLGSLFRSAFGEEVPKRYGIIEDDKISFVENTAAYDYITYEFNEDDKVYQSSDEIMNVINDVKEKNKELFNGDKHGKIRMIFHLPENVDPSFRENLKTLIFNDKIITPMLKENITETVTDTEDEVKTEYDFILDPNMKIADKIYNYILKTYESSMSIKDIEHYINDPLSI